MTIEEVRGYITDLVSAGMTIRDARTVDDVDGAIDRRSVAEAAMVEEFVRLQDKPAGQSDLDRYIGALEEWREYDDTVRHWKLTSPKLGRMGWTASATSGDKRRGATPALALASLCTALGLEATNG